MTDEFGFKDKEIPIDALFNEEQLLDFALHYLSMKNSDDDDVHPVAEQIVVAYVLREYQKRGKWEFTEEEVADSMSELLANYVLTNLVNKGLIEVEFRDGETLYRRSEDYNGSQDR